VSDRHKGRQPFQFADGKPASEERAFRYAKLSTEDTESLEPLCQSLGTLVLPILPSVGEAAGPFQLTL